MSENKISKEKANKVYDLLVSIGGAYEPDRDNFIYHHTESKDGCNEWRFGGKLGFGGKYRSEYNSVGCYMEDETDERKNIIIELNRALCNINKMKIIYLGTELDSSVEHELFSNNEFGFKITIGYTDESWYPIKEEIAFNFTEFHWRYTDIFNITPSNGVAFESDIHGTGFTRKIDVISYVNIELADNLYQIARK